MIKSEEKFKKIIKSKGIKGKYSPIEDYLKCFDDESLGKLIEDWNIEKDNIEPEDFVEALMFCRKLYSLRRLSLCGRNESKIPKVQIV